MPKGWLFLISTPLTLNGRSLGLGTRLTSKTHKKPFLKSIGHSRKKCPLTLLQTDHTLPSVEVFVVPDRPIQNWWPKMASLRPIKLMGIQQRTDIYQLPVAPKHGWPSIARSPWPAFPKTALCLAMARATADSANSSRSGIEVPHSAQHK